MSPASVLYLPWVRRGAATQIGRDENSTSTAPRANVDVSVVFNAGTIQKAVELFGPEDVAGLESRAVVRTSPQRDALHAFSMDFPFVELSEADLPWRFTPARASSTGRLSPWLRLIVVRENEIQRFEAPNASRKVGELDVTGEAALPRADQAWAWAHVQVSGLASTQAGQVPTLLASEPERFVARLLCPRWLEPDTSYLACLVPVFERGRRAALGVAQDSSVGPFAYAWQQGVAPPTLAAYFHWRFRTGAAGDFETLARRLQGVNLKQTQFVRRMSATNPGLGLPAASSADVPVEGALQGKAVLFDPDVAFKSAIWSLIDGPENSTETAPQAPPVVGPPAYGRWHAATRKLTGTTTPQWFVNLNVDPRWRVAAALGTAVVQAQQRQLLASAWEQLGALKRANEALRFSQLSREASERFYERDIKMAGDDAAVWLTSAVQGRVLESTGTGTLASAVAGSALDVGVLQSQWRRLARPRGPLGRRQGRHLPGAASSTLLSRMTGAEALRAARIPPPPDAMSTPLGWAEKLGSSLNPEFEIGAMVESQNELPPWATLLFAMWSLAAIEGTDPLYKDDTGPWFDFLGSAQDELMGRAVARGYFDEVVATQVPGRDAFAPREVLSTEQLTSSMEQPGDGGDSSEAAAFRAALLNLAARLDFEALDAPTPKTLDLAAIRGRMEQAINPRQTVAAGIKGRIQLSSKVTWTPADDLEPVLAHPEFPQPMYKALVELGHDWLVPGVSQLEDNRVAGLVTNQAFVEAFMAGLSHEMARELLWHEYPTDQRGTYFRQFWDPAPFSGSDEGDKLQDIKAITDWTGDIGGNRPDLPGGASVVPVVLAVRAELLRRYPGTTIYAAKASSVNGPGDASDEILHPMFGAQLPPDIRFFGFNKSAEDFLRKQDEGTSTQKEWYFVFEENVLDTRFGLDDVDTPPATLQSWNDLAWQHLVAATTLAPGGFIDLDAHTSPPPVDNPSGAVWSTASKSSDFAAISMQRPMRVAFKASDLLPLS